MMISIYSEMIPYHFSVDWYDFYRTDIFHDFTTKSKINDVIHWITATSYDKSVYCIDRQQVNDERLDFDQSDEQRDFSNYAIVYKSGVSLCDTTQSAFDLTLNDWTCHQVQSSSSRLPERRRQKRQRKNRWDSEKTDEPPSLARCKHSRSSPYYYQNKYDTPVLKLHLKQWTLYYSMLEWKHSIPIEGLKLIQTAKTSINNAYHCIQTGVTRY